MQVSRFNQVDEAFLSASLTRKSPWIAPTTAPAANNAPAITTIDCHNTDSLNARSIPQKMTGIPNSHASMLAGIHIPPRVGELPIVAVRRSGRWKWLLRPCLLAWREGIPTGKRSAHRLTSPATRQTSQWMGTTAALLTTVPAQRTSLRPRRSEQRLQRKVGCWQLCFALRCSRRIAL
jgi:hypothetical protein